MMALRVLGLACLLPLLVACGRINPSELPGAMQLEGGNAVSGSRTLTDDRYVRLLERAGEPGVRAMMAARVDRNTKSLLMMASRAADGTETWLTADGGSVSFQDGMLVATRKIPPDMIAADVSEVSALVHARRGGQAERFHSYLDGNHSVYIRSYVCTVTPGALEPLVLLNGSTRTVRVMAEHCTGRDETFENFYWVDPGTGEILTSLQYASRDAGAFLFQEVRR
ncbi:YjbF family lipoprotein [Pseudooceanicola marinus]|uniref:YjbF family lipoprotein n=1 Tax=Pseudooceanicola marinus TaxID=396013 RepID=UPI001CD695FE|nr:YjbF family lipoprotein [Pseudooceanicola marinus]MCA1338187.1 YjbF family lipoprotein [Pseudooceanicola marinus]